jgi:CRP-like cAMP-binding protein
MRPFFYFYVKKKMKFDVLYKSPLFLGLTETETDSLIESVNFRVRSYPSGTIAALSGEEIRSVMIVLSGSMRGEMVDLAGHIIKIEDVLPPQALAAAFIYASGAKYPVNVIANEDSEILIIDRNDFLTLMHRDTRILSNYLRAVCTKAVFLSERLRFLSFRTIKGKFAHYLASLPGASSGVVKTDRTQQELSEYFGVTRPSLARAMGEMAEEGIIAVDRREVRILNFGGLSSLSRL